jgi:glycosyltransferase involved in cell wall biosynthesis
MPTRVTHVALQLETGGMERLLVEFARLADRPRYSLQFVSLTSRGRVADDIESCGWPVVTLGVRPGLKPGAAFRLARLLQESSTDIVHTHNTRPLVYGGAAGRLAQVRAVVHTRHGQRHFSTARQDRLFRAAARCADRIVCVSEDAAARSRFAGIGGAAVRTIWNGVDLARFQGQSGSAGGPAVFVGRLSPEKDVATLLRATSIVVQREPSFRLQIAGDGPCVAELHELAGALGVRGRVEFLGEVQDVPGLLRRAGVFVLPSLSEGLALTVLEAMACGLPVVATQVGGTPEAVLEGETGLLVPAEDPRALADALLRVHRDATLARTLGTAGRARAHAHFDARVMVRRYESLYSEVLAAGEAVAA